MVYGDLQYLDVNYSIDDSSYHYYLGPYCLTVGSTGVNLGHTRVLIGLGPFNADNGMLGLWTDSPPLHCLGNGIEKKQKKKQQWMGPPALLGPSSLSNPSLPAILAATGPVQAAPRFSPSIISPLGCHPVDCLGAGHGVQSPTRPGLESLYCCIYTIWYKIYDTMTLNEWSWIQEYYNALMHHLPPYEFQHCSLQGECWPQTREAGLPFQIQIRLFHCKPDYSTCSFPPLVAHSTEGTCTIGCW